MLADLRYALRGLIKSPGFTIVAVLTLALGIGVNALIFGFVRSLVLQPMIRDREQRLVAVYTAGRGANRDFRHFSYPEFSVVRGSHEIFSDVAAFGLQVSVIGQTGNFRRSLVEIVSENYFSLLHTQPFQGRSFSSAESQPGAGIPVAIAAYSYWQRLGAPADFIGTKIEINNQPYTIVGIMPDGGGNLTSIGPELWLPLGAAAQIWGGRGAPADFLGPRTYELSLLGALQPGLTRSEATDRATLIDRRLNAPSIGDPGAPRQLILMPPPSFSVGNDRPIDEGFLLPFAAIAVGLTLNVLLVASFNLANMMLARGASRQKEIAIRLSLGASRSRIIRQLMAESLLLAVLAGGLGVLFSRWVGIYLHRLVVGDFASSKFALSRWHGKDAGDFIALAVLALASSAVFGLLPAFRATRVNLVDDLKRQPGEPAAGGEWNRFFSPRHCLMMAQVALSFMLLFSAALFVRGTQNAINLNPGFRTEGEVVLNLDYVDPALTKTTIARRQQKALVRALELPGVTDAALAAAVPFNFETDWWRIFPAGGDTAALNPDDKTTHAAPMGIFAVVSRGYFKTLGIPLLQGRDFTQAESTLHGGHQVAIIDEGLARALFGDKNPVGRRLATNSEQADIKHPERAIEIVGIVRSPHEEVFEAEAPHRLYRPLGQFQQSNIYLHLRVADPASAPAVLDRLQGELRSLDPDTPVLSAQPLSDFIDKNLNLLLVRMAGIVFGLSGLIALVLAVIGVYGIKSHAVVRRTREIGIRIALGAQPRDVLALIVKQGVLQAAVGLCGGLVLALLAGRLAAKMLYHVSPFDPLALVTAAVLLASTVLLACFLPGRRATKVDPAITLRAE